MKTQYCHDCIHKSFPEILGKLKCRKGHKPRFYMPRDNNPLDTLYGWKRKCADFESEANP